MMFSKEEVCPRCGSDFASQHDYDMQHCRCAEGLKMKTITFNPETHKLVSVDLLRTLVESEDMHAQCDAGDAVLELLNAAPAEEEAPQREHHDINKIAEALRRVGLTLLQTANGYHVMKLGEVTAQAQQQPATHGEPVAWIQWTGGKCPIEDDVVFEYFTINGEHHGPTSSASRLDWSHDYHLNNGDIIAYRPYTPQPTPELVQAAKLALNALNPRPGMPNPEYESLVACAIDALQNALKGTT